MSDAASGYGWADILTALVRGEDLTAEATSWAMDVIMSGEATPAQIAGFAVALRSKGETVDEIEGLVRAMYEHATLIDVEGPILDVVGTGGDRARTVNISTMAAIVAAGAGAKVVKHGNRASSSASGSADLLERLGVVLTLRPDQIARVIDDVGITFCFATLFHPALRHTATTRREIGIPTAFNFLGPLTNPARASAGAIGVFDPRMAPIMAGVLARRGASALVFRGDDGLDELTVTTTSRIWRVADGEVSEHVFDPRSIGIATAGPDDLRGGDPAHNAAVARAVLKGEPGPVRDAVLLNAAAGLVALDPPAGSLTDGLAAAYARAAAAVDSGAAAALLDRWIDVTGHMSAEA